MAYLGYAHKYHIVFLVCNVHIEKLDVHTKYQIMWVWLKFTKSLCGSFITLSLVLLTVCSRLVESGKTHYSTPSIPPNCTRLIWIVKAGDCVQMCLESGQALCPERTCGLGLFTLALSQINPHTTCKASQDTTHTALFSPPPFRNFSAY